MCLVHSAWCLVVYVLCSMLRAKSHVCRSFPKNIISDIGHGKAAAQRAIRAIYGRVPFEKASNLHAGPCDAEMRKDRLLRCSLFLSLPFWPLLVFLLSDCSRSVALLRRRRMSPGTTEETSGGDFHLQTSANWPLTIGYKNDPFIFGETPGIFPLDYLKLIRYKLLF